MIKTQLVDGLGSSNGALITDQNALCVAQIVPPLETSGTESRQRYFNNLLGSTGAGGGTTSQNVDGSTPQEFFIGSNSSFDIRIEKVVILIVGNSITLSKFGAISALTNGIDLKVRESGEETFIYQAAKTNGEIIVQTGAVNNIYANFSSTDNGIVIEVNLMERQGGLRIGRGTQDRLRAIVNDDLQTVKDFTIRAIGHRHYP